MRGKKESDPKADLKIIARDADAKLASVEKLIAAGIPEDDVSSVLELRENMTEYEFSRPKNKQIIAQPAIDVMIEAWEGANRDLDVLESIVDYACKSVDRSRRVTFQVLNASLLHAVDLYKKGGLDALDVDDGIVWA